VLTWYDKRICFVDLSDKVRPATLFNSLETGGGGDLRDLGRFFFDFLLFSLSPGDVTVGAIVTDQLFSLWARAGLPDSRRAISDNKLGYELNWSKYGSALGIVIFAILPTHAKQPVHFYGIGCSSLNRNLSWSNRCQNGNHEYGSHIVTSRKNC